MNNTTKQEVNDLITYMEKCTPYMPTVDKLAGESIEIVIPLICTLIDEFSELHGVDPRDIASRISHMVREVNDEEGRY